MSWSLVIGYEIQIFCIGVSWRTGLDLEWQFWVCIEERVGLGIFCGSWGVEVWPRLFHATYIYVGILLLKDTKSLTKQSNVHFANCSALPFSFSHYSLII